MSTIAAVLVLGLLFAAFALMGSAERSTPCGGADAEGDACDLCPLGPEGGLGERCPLEG